MPQPIEIPNRQLQTVPTRVDPTPLVEGYLNRQQQGSQYSSDLMMKVAQMMQEQKWKEMELKAGAFKAGGPEFFNQMFPQGGGQASTTQPGQMAGQAMAPPTQAMSAQTLQPGQVQPMSEDQYHGIANGLGVQPDFATYNKRMQGHVSKLSDINQRFGASDWGVRSAKMEQDSMASDKAAMEAQTAPMDYALKSGQAAMLPTEMATKQQQLSNAQQQIPMEINKTVAGEVGKQTESVENIKQIESAYQGMVGALDKNKPSPVANIRGRVVGAFGTDKPYGIPIGSMPAHDVNEAGSKLAAALSAEITKSGRYTPYVAESLISAMVPTAKETPEVYRSKLQSVQTFLTALKSGNQQNIDNVVAAMGGTTNLQGGAGQQSQANIQTISSDAAFKDLPSGTQFKDPSGQVHRKK
jgi:hypothetical protein